MEWRLISVCAAVSDSALHTNVHPPFAILIPQTTCPFSSRTRIFNPQDDIAKKRPSKSYSSIIPHLRYFLPQTGSDLSSASCHNAKSRRAR
jgi:hypothetical protein